ncbi:MAG: FAD-dependent oxidoreductase [Kiritimatiellae bacterium]|nr:FAD-dependent oxidoreductase [Kiritimatiellia bacterium]
MKREREFDFVERDEREIYGTFWDVIVFGAGYAGYAAAQAAAKAGKSVLLVDGRCDLLWESARARHPESGPFTPEFAQFGRAIACATGIAADWIDPGSAEWVANELLMEGKVKRLYFATPVSARLDGDGLLASVAVALRNGYEIIRAKQWIDATETGVVARLCDALITPSSPSRRIARVFLQRLRWPIDCPLAFDSGIRGVQATLETSEWSGERILRMELDKSYTRPFARVFTPALKALRAKLGPEFDNAFVSHWSYDPYPVYTRGRRSATSPAANLALASPSLASGSFTTLVERHSLGVAAFQKLFGMASRKDAKAGREPWPPKPVRTIETDIFVAGLGTGGTLAAIAAGRRGAKVVAAESQTFPGGVATGAGIPAYYWGCPGGLQREIDEAVDKLMPVFAARANHPQGFHSLARRIVSEDMLNAVGVTQLYGATILWGTVKCRGNRIASVLVATDDGVVEVRAKAWIDATGEGELCCCAWIPGSVGRPGDNFMNAFTQSWGAFGYFQNGLQTFITNPDSGFVNPDDSLDMTTARILGTHRLVETSSVRSSNALNRTTGVMPAIGIRQGKLIATQHPLTIDDMVERRRFPDAIGFTGGHVDTHSRDFFAESRDMAFYNLVAKAWSFPTACEIPSGAILPNGLTNAWLACRAAGGSEMAGGDEMTCYAFRMQRDMQRIGEAAGLAAAIAVEEGKTNAKIPYAKLREALLASGALAPLKDEKPLFGRATTTFDGDPVLTGPATDENIGKWLKALANKEPGIALWRLYRLGPDALKSKVLSILRKGTATAKWHAALLLAGWECKEAQPHLIACLEDKSCGDGRMAAAWALGQCGDRRAYPVLAALAADKSAPALERLTALWSCGDIAQREIKRKHAVADVQRLKEMMAATRDIFEPSRPWERALCTERLRRALGLKPDKEDFDALSSNPWLLVRCAYDRFLLETL